MNVGALVVTSNKEILAQAQKALGLKVVRQSEFVSAMTAPNKSARSKERNFLLCSIVWTRLQRKRLIVFWPIVNMWSLCRN